ncbi:LVIVD repeat-containing protein [Mesonia aquimarina]|uniref:hypothetical protein n=1 Tax=Mesonia aquimarina TaxID=1504967 RepID=UPI000EF5E8CD|nr:hypothetical protein [Mesonia aquimarina]
MKKLIYFFLAIIIIACSADNSDGGNSPNEIAVDGQGGSLARFTLNGDYLYTVDEESLNIFNISDTREPVYKGDVHIGFEIETLFSLEDKLYVGSRLGMYIYDISSRENPLLLSEVQHLRSCDPVVSSGDYTYVTLHTNASCEGDLNQLEIYNTENELEPILLTTIEMNRPIGLGLYENYLLVADEGVVRILDVTEPQFPDLIGGIPVDGFDVIIRQNHLFVIGESSIWQYQLNPEAILEYTELSQLEF